MNNALNVGEADVLSLCRCDLLFEIAHLCSPQAVAGYGTAVSSERRNTGVDYEQGLRAFDAKRIAVYFSKHGSANYGDKEYQNRPPALWIEAGSIGRFWGYWGLEPLTVTTEVSEADALFIARTLHRWARANSRPRRITVWRTNQRTGEVRPRHAHRRSVRLTSRTGFVAVNDGSAMGQALARALVARCPLECGRQRASTDQ